MGVAAVLRRRAGGIADAATRVVGRMIVNPVWMSVYRELDAWQAAGRTPRFWWRDDDAVAATPQLDRLLDVTRRHHVPVALAVIPATVDRSLEQRLRGEPHVAILQHGWDHANHAAAGQPPSELVASREPLEVQTELALGLSRLETIFGPRLLPALVPPNNRIAPQLTPVASRLYRYVSIFGDFGGPSMPSRNVHVDLIDWDAMEPEPIGKIIPALVFALRLRRLGVVAPALPIGILSHHLAMSVPMWGTVDAVLTNLRVHPVVSFRPPQEVFA